jgi:hypothetical protein
MPYNRFERSFATLLDSLPGLRRAAKAGYQRVNYLLQGGRHERMRLHPGAAIERIPDVPRGADERNESHECFFGYFGVSPWSRAGDRYLFHRWHRRRSSVEICVYDCRSAVSRVIADSSAWSFQQGSMAQWLDANDGGESIIFNDYVDRQLACRIVRPDGRERSIPWPIQAVHPAGSEALSLNYRRLSLIQPEYVYGLDADNFTADQPLDQDGIWRVDLRSSDSRLVVSLDDLTKHSPRPEMRDAGHAVNHAVYSPRGSRVAFMHRWRSSLGLFSRLYCATPDGSNLRLLLDHRMVSHYAWRDENTLLVWARTPEDGDRYFLLDVTTGDLEVCCAGTLDRFGDGHPSFAPDSEWLVTDTYPDRGRMRHLLLCRPATGTVLEAGAFFSPWHYDGDVRCDLHPRWDATGRSISIDSAHEGLRGTYAVDVSRLLADYRNR